MFLLKQIAVFTLLVAATATSQVIADPPQTSADVWLDRAQRDIAKLPAETPKEFRLLTPEELAEQLYLTAPTDQRRAMALARLASALQAYLDKKPPAQQVRAIYADVAMFHAKLDDLAGARRLLELSGQPTTAPTTDPSLQWASGLDDTSRAETYLLLGDTAAFNRLNLPAFPALLVANDLRALGKLPEAKLADEISHRAALDYAKTQIKKSTDDGQNRVDAVLGLAQQGNFEAAMKIAATADDAPRGKDGYNLPAGWLTFEAYVDIGRYALRAKDIPHFQAAESAAIAILRKTPDNVGEGLLEEFVGQCAQARDDVNFETAAQIYRTRLDHSTPQRDLLEKANPFAKLALYFASMGSNRAYASAADAAEKLLAAPADTSGLSVDEKKERPRKVAMAYLWIAVARARAGDLVGVKRDADASRKVTALDPGYWDEPWSEVIESYVAAGLLDEAVNALALAREDADYGGLHMKVGWSLAKAGRFDDAWKLSARTATHGRIMLEYRLTVAEVQAHRQSQAAARVDELPSPYEKALVELAIGQALAGKEYRGDFRIFRARED